MKSCGRSPCPATTLTEPAQPSSPGRQLSLGRARLGIGPIKRSAHKTPNYTDTEKANELKARARASILLRSNPAPQFPHRPYLRSHPTPSIPTSTTIVCTRSKEPPLDRWKLLRILILRTKAQDDRQRHQDYPLRRAVSSKPPKAYAHLALRLLDKQGGRCAHLRYGAGVAWSAAAPTTEHDLGNRPRKDMFHTSGGIK